MHALVPGRVPRRLEAPRTLHVFRRIQLRGRRRRAVKVKALHFLCAFVPRRDVERLDLAGDLLPWAVVKR